MGVITKYKFNSSLYADYLPVFDYNFTDYTVSDVDNGDNTITRTISHSTSKPILMRFGTTSGVTDRERSLMEVIECDTSQVTNMISMFQHCSLLTSLDLSSFDTSKVDNMFAMFQGCTLLASLNISNFNTSQVTNMSKMFYGCTNLTSLNLSNFNTSNVTTMSYMFTNCSSLTSLNISSFNTNKVTEMNWMFSNCGKLIQLDLSSFDTSKVKLMDNMFNGCSSLTSLNVSNFNTSEVTTMVSMFQSCRLLITLDLSNFNTNKVTNMASMFFGCYGLISLNISNFNTNQVIDMANMFQYCSALTSLDLSNFNTNKVTSMANMFNACNKLNSLDLSSFNTNSVTNMNTMFTNCGKLTSLDLSNFDTSKVTDMNSMFGSCPLLSDIGLLYATSSTINSLLTPLTETNVARNIYYTDAPLDELTVHDNITYKEYKISSRATFPYTLNKLPSGVADYIDVVNKVYVQRVGKFVADGGDDRVWSIGTFSNSSVNTECTIFSTNISDKLNNWNINQKICDKWNLYDTDIISNDIANIEGIHSGGNTDSFFINVSNTKAKTVEQWKTYLQSNPFTYLYELATPIYTPLTEEEITQLPLSAYKDGYINLSSDQLTPSMDLRMRASNRYQVDMLETNSYYYLNAPVGNIKLGREDVNVTSMPCIIKTGSSLSGDSDYRLGLENIGIYFTFGSYIHINGEILSSTGDAISDYLFITDRIVGITSDDSRSSGFGICIAFYDESRKFITRFSSDSNEVVSSSKYFEASVPSNAKYCRMSYRVTEKVSRNNYSVIGAHNPITLAKLPSHRIPSSFTQGMKCATDFGYWEGVKEAQIWSLVTYDSSWTLVDSIFTTGLQKAGTLNRLEGTYQTSATIEDEFDYATGKLIRRVGKVELNSTNVEAISHIVQSKEYLYVTLYGDKLGGNFGTSLTTNKNYGLCITDKTSFNVSYGGDFNHSFIADGNIVLYLKTNEFGGIPTIEGIRDYFSKHPLTIYYEMAIPEISYITDLPKNYVTTVATSTKLLSSVKDKNLYLQPQVKPSLLSYPTSLSTNTQYTVIHNRKNYDGSVKTPMINLGGTEVPATGTHTLVTTPSTLAHNELRFIGGENTVEQVMVLQGDWTKEGKTVDYFEGMQSSIIGNKTLENLVGEPVEVWTDSNITYVTMQDVKDKYEGRPKFNSADIIGSCESQGLTLKNLLVDEPTKSTDYQYNFTGVSGLKQNTVYTLMFDINQQFSSDITSETTTGFYFGILNGDNSDWNCNSKEYYTKGVQSLKTRIKAKITTTSYSLGTVVRITSISGSYLETFEITNAILLEGDYTNLDIPYFEGMQSVKMPVLETTGKNLFDGQIIRNACLGTNGGHYNLDGAITFAKMVYVKGLKEICLSISNSYDSSMSMVYSLYDKNKNFICRAYGNYISGTGAKFSISDDVYYLRATFHTFSTTAIGDDVDIKIQLEEGSVATPYEPYKSNILSTSSELELRSTGEYRDTIDWKTGSISRRTVEFSISGEEGYGWSVSENTKTLVVSVAWSKLGLGNKIPSNNSSVPLICDKLPWSSGSKDEVHIRCDDGTPYSNTLMMYLDKTKFSTYTSQAVNDYIKSIGGLTVVAPLADIKYETANLVGGGNWDKVILDGSETWLYDINDSEYFQVYITRKESNKFNNSLTENEGAICFNNSNPNYYYYFNIGNSYAIRIRIIKSKFPKDLSSSSGTINIDVWKQYLQQNPITVWYQTSTVLEQTSNTDPIFFDGGSISLTSSLLPVQSYDRIALPTTNRYIIDSLDALKYTVITNQSFYLNGVDYSASSTGLTVIDILSVKSKELFSDDEDITLVQDDGNYYANGVLTQFKGSKEFVKEFIVTDNGTKRTGMKLLEPIELNGTSNGVRDIYNPLTGEIIKYNVVVKYNEANVSDVRDVGLGAKAIDKPTNKKVYGVYKLNNLCIPINGDYNNKSLVDNSLYYYENPESFVVWSNVLTSTQIHEYLKANDFTIVYAVQNPDIVKINDMKPYISTRPENGTIESLDSKLQSEYLNYDDEQSILAPHMLGEGDSIYWEQGSQCYVYANNEEYIPLESYGDQFGVNIDAMDVEQYVENLEGSKVELGVPLKEKAVYEQTYNKYEDNIIYPSDLENIDETNGVEVDYICGATWQNPDDLSDIRHLGTLRDDGQYEVNIRRSGDDEIRLFDGTTHISLDGSGLNPSEFELTFFNKNDVEVGKYGDINHMLEDCVEDSKLETGMVYGETLVNVFNYTPDEMATWVWSSKDSGGVSLWDSSGYMTKVWANVQAGKTYTMIYVNAPSHYLGFYSANTFTDGYSQTQGKYSVFAVKDDYVEGTKANFILKSSQGFTDEELANIQIVVVEGDYTSYPTGIPYFEGVGSTIVNGFASCGKNLFNPEIASDRVEYLGEGYYKANADGQAHVLFNVSAYNKIKPNTTYTITVEVKEKTTEGLFEVQYYREETNCFNKSIYANDVGTYVFTYSSVGNITKDMQMLGIKLISQNINGYIIFRIQIEEGSNSTEFEIPKQITYTLPTPITLNGVNNEYENIQDTFDLTTQIQTKNITHMLLDGSHTCVNNFNTDTERGFIIKLEEECAKLNRTIYKDDIFNIYTTTSSSTQIYCSVTKQSDIEDTYNAYASYLNQWLSSNNIDFWYKLNTSITTQHTLIPSSTQATQEPTFILPQPLRSVPNGICDRLYWDDTKGHYCIEKRVGDVLLDGVARDGFDYNYNSYASDSNTYRFFITNTSSTRTLYLNGNLLTIISDKLKALTYTQENNGYIGIANYGGNDINFSGRVTSSDLETTDNEGVKKYFTNNPTTVYYPLMYPQIIDLPYLDQKLELPTQPDILPIGYKAQHDKVNPQLGLTIPTKVLNLPKQPVDLNFIMRDNQIGDYILTWSEIKEARQYNIILNDDVIATTKIPEYNTGEEIYGYILVEAQNELGENLSKELYVKTVPNAPAQLTVSHNPNTDCYDFDISFISTSAIADYYTIKYCVDNGDWIIHDIQASDIELDTKILYSFSVYDIKDNIQVHATATNDMGTNDILPIATYYMSPTPQWTYRINSKEAFIRWIDESPYDLKYKVRYSYLSDGTYKYAYFEGDTTEIGKLYEMALPLAEDDQLTLSICLVSDKENLYCKPVKMSKELDPNIVPPINFKYRWLARGLVEFSWEDNYDVDVKYEYVLEHKLSDATEWESITDEIVSEDVEGKGTVYTLEYQLQDLEEIRVKIRMVWAMNETEWTETLATVFIPVEGNPPTWIRRTQTQEGLLVQWEAQSYVDSYHLYIVDAEGKVLQHIETLDDFVYVDIDYSQPIELHIYEKTRFSGGIESDPTDEMVFTPTMYDVQHRMDIYHPCAESYEMEISTIQKGSKAPYVIHDVSYTPNTKSSGDVVTSISSPFQISYHPLGIDVHQAGSKAYAPLDLSVKTLGTKFEHQFDVMTFERITDKYDMNFNVYTPSTASYPITLEVSKVRIVCLGDSKLRSVC